MSAREAIDAITVAMSQINRGELADDSVTTTAYNHLRNARRLLVAKYQPNTEQIGR